MKHYVIRRKSDGLLAYRGSYQSAEKGFDVFCENAPEINIMKNNDKVEIVEVTITFK